MQARCARERADPEGSITEARPPGSRNVMPVIPANLVFHSDAPVELNQVGAAPEQDMLAVVDYFAGAGMLIGRGPAPQIRTPLEQSDPQAAFRQRTTRGQSCQPASHDCNSRRLCPAARVIKPGV